MASMNSYGGPAMSDRFYVNFTIPSGLSSFGQARDLQYQCHTAELPGVTLGTADFRTYGPTRKIATGTEYAPISFTMYCTNAFWEKPLFENWIEYINPRNAGWDLRFKDEYSSPILITQIDMNDSIIYQCAINKAFPVAIAPLPLSWSSNSIHELQVMMVYDNYSLQPSSANLFGLNFTPPNQTFIGNNPISGIPPNNSPANQPFIDNATV